MQHKVYLTAAAALLAGHSILRSPAAADVRNASPPGTTLGTVEPAPAPSKSDVSEAAEKLIDLLEKPDSGGLSPELRARLAALVTMSKQAERDQQLLGAVSELTASLVDANKEKAFTPSRALADALAGLASQANMLSTTADAVVAFDGLASMTVHAMDSVPLGAATTGVGMLYGKITERWTKTTDGGFVQLSKTITDLLKTDAKLKQQLVLDLAAREAAKTLTEAIKPLAEAAQKRVHIVAALYGDRRTISRVVQLGKAATPGAQDRWCNATAAMRTQCEYKTDCTAPAAVATSLCGYDPVPYASPQFKAAVVFYRCLDANEPAQWTDAAGSANKRNSVNLPKAGGAYSVSLWNDKQGIYCTAP
ncbi:hypothetical protein ELH33_32960 (plasmid) [Rhizobium ruizarguesonis]|uniref:hypothetical protein n=1 Tax=Rhizobium ruizarguesonis TaxID=2081791 RepID=UPI001031BA42|nr:hypothetical protein [Rhizobium ruizarguesonis]TBC25590.1 hypothetical protein ELH33_32960 [Rhizobium ruizarguesonis]